MSVKIENAIDNLRKYERRKGYNGFIINFLKELEED